MKKYLISALFLIVVVSYVNAQLIQNRPKSNKLNGSGASNSNFTYTTKYDNINLDEILNSKRLVSNYVQCLLNAKPCSPEGQELKKMLPDALKTKCAKCTDRQRAGALKVITVVQRDYPDEWKKLLQKWDPTGEFFKSFQEEQIKLLKNKN